MGYRTLYNRPAPPCYCLRRLGAWIDGRHEGGVAVAIVRRLVRTTYLELAADVPLQPPTRERPDHELRQAVAVSPEFSRFLYTSVGWRWNWNSRLGWNHAAWQGHLSQAGLETWVAYVEGVPAGYFELRPGPANSGEGVEIVQFGLLPAFVGRSLGGHLLCDAAARGREVGSGRVWLHTCTEDHPHALANYRARGFVSFKVEEETEDVLIDGEPWPGAHPPR